jgi:Na+/glutamate symporter
MDIFYFVIGGILGFILAKSSNDNDKNKPEEKLEEQIKKLTEDVVYYKKLTKTLTDENVEFRRKQK